jgi:hypothetical protein
VRILKLLLTSSFLTSGPNLVCSGHSWVLLETQKSCYLWSWMVKDFPGFPRKILICCMAFETHCLDPRTFYDKVSLPKVSYDSESFHIPLFLSFQAWKFPIFPRPSIPCAAAKACLPPIFLFPSYLTSPTLDGIALLASISEKNEVWILMSWNEKVYAHLYGEPTGYNKLFFPLKQLLLPEM